MWRALFVITPFLLPCCLMLLSSPTFWWAELWIIRDDMGNQLSGDRKKGKAKKNQVGENNNQGSVFGKLKQCQPPFSKFVLVPCTATAQRAVSVAGSEAAAGIRLRFGNNVVGTGGGSLGLGIPVDAKVRPEMPPQFMILLCTCRALELKSSE